MATKKPSDNSLHHETDDLLGNERRIHTRPHQEAFRHPLGHDRQQGNAGRNTG
nr:MAG TPA: hypothetical protein [Caudoviricetes sp.]